MKMTNRRNQVIYRLWAPIYDALFVNLFSTMFGTDITRKFGDIHQGSQCTLIRNDPSILRGMYRVILLKKPQP